MKRRNIGSNLFVYPPMIQIITTHDRFSVSQGWCQKNYPRFDLVFPFDFRQVLN